jgi:hypothetical protein
MNNYVLMLPKVAYIKTYHSLKMHKTNKFTVFCKYSCSELWDKSNNRKGAEISTPTITAQSDE